VYGNHFYERPHHFNASCSPTSAAHAQPQRIASSTVRILASTNMQSLVASFPQASHGSPTQYGSLISTPEGIVLIRPRSLLMHSLRLRHEASPHCQM
jgi:hypothetical protein